VWEVHSARMDFAGGLEVRVERRGRKFVWVLHREGVTQPIKFSVPIYSSEVAARNSGNEARKDHLARLAARAVKKTSVKRALP
jgi:hypothetical protein